jgi:hypothetical protein
MELLIQAFGVGLIILALFDIYLSVLFPRFGSSVLSFFLAKQIWSIFRTIVHVFPRQRDRLLMHSGAVVIITVIVVWILLLISGFALIIWVDLGWGVQDSQDQTPTDFWTALYFSGYVFTTLGIGDLVPESDSYRMLVLWESALGFAMFTLTITYILAIYAALSQRNAFGLSLHHRSDDTASAVELLIRLLPDDNINNAQQDIASIADNVILLLEGQHSYPVLIYFRFSQKYYSLCRVMFLSMDTVSLIKSALHPDHYRSIIRSAGVTELWRGGLHLVLELTESLFSKARLKNNRNFDSIWRDRYYQAVEKLQAEGIKTRPDLEAGADLYITLRQQWTPHLMALAHYMAYDWREIASPDRVAEQSYPR